MNFEGESIIYEFKKLSGIYFLYDDGLNLIYIGSSEDILYRLSIHKKKGVRFSHFSFIDTNGLTVQEMKQREIELIIKLKPINNKTIHGTKRWVLLNKVKKNVRLLYGEPIEYRGKKYLDMKSKTNN